MGSPTVLISENGRRRLAKAAGVLNWIGLLPCLVVLAVGVYVHLKLEEKESLIEGMDSKILPCFMMSVGGVGVVSCLIGGKVCWANHKPRKRPTWSKFLLPYVILLCIVILGILISGIVCFVHINLLHHSFGKGIKTAMKIYSTDSFKKQIIDRLQIEFKCCGSSHYTDWFITPWVNRDHLGKEKRRKLKE